MVYIEAPASFDTLSDNRVLVTCRSVCPANVPPKEIASRSKPPKAEVVDFGTVFLLSMWKGCEQRSACLRRPRCGVSASDLENQMLFLRPNRVVQHPSGRVNDSSQPAQWNRLGRATVYPHFSNDRNTDTRAKIKKLSPARVLPNGDS